MSPTVDHAHAAFELVRDVLLPSGAITYAQAQTIASALFHLLTERDELRKSILRTEEALIQAQRALADRDRNPRPDGGPPDAG